MSDDDMQKRVMALRSFIEEGDSNPLADSRREHPGESLDGDDEDIRKEVREYLLDKLLAEKTRYQNQLDRLNVRPNYRDRYTIRWSEILIAEADKMLATLEAEK